MLGTLEIDWHQVWEKVSGKGIQKEKNMYCRKRGMSPKDKGIDPGWSCRVLSVENSLEDIIYKALRWAMFPQSYKKICTWMFYNLSEVLVCAWSLQKRQM